MNAVLETIRALIATRGTQLIARYVAIGVTALGTKLAMDPASVNANGTAEAVASFVVAALLLAIDHYSHKEQAK